MNWKKLIASIPVIFTIVGLPLSIFLYYKSNVYPSLTYYVYPVRAALVRKGNISALEAVYDGKKIEGDVTVAQIAIWNRGKQPISKSLRLRPVELYTEPNTPILDATIRKSSRDIINFNLDNSQLTLGRLQVNWDILEQDDGAIIQIVYVGDEHTLFKMDGILIGQKTISSFTNKYEQFDVRNYYTSLILLLYFLVVVIVKIPRMIKYNKRLEEIHNSDLDSLKSYAIHNLGWNSKINRSDLWLLVAAIIVPILDFIYYNIIQEKIPLVF